VRRNDPSTIAAIATNAMVPSRSRRLGSAEELPAGAGAVGAVAGIARAGVPF